MPKQQLEQGRNWYVLHTYSGYEDAVARNLHQRIQSLGMEDKIFQVVVPKEKKIKIKNGKRRIVEERIYPGYVLVEITPTPIAETEIKSLMARMGVKEPKYKIDVSAGDVVKITDGPVKDFEGKVAEVDEEKGLVKVLVSLFGRETPVQLDSLQLKKI
ncbi:transcription termination/antitermination protein NusG [Candidatus Azambacteria bacterium]|nr:transcription termination/antitermination protein NusG [Candidatus Azambacteria bacterium]